eukprot:m.5931 g.5931  ORF g.5931 m.5931 type:complete len:172 (-) comp2516_c0_seq1:168-683(-)
MNMGFVIRQAEEKDVSAIVGLIRLLAIYENAEDQVKITEEMLLKDGFTEPKRFHCFVAEDDNVVVGYALYFYIYSTWEGVSLYLEDLFVKKENRGKGIGLGLVNAVISNAREMKCARVQWQVIDWNESAIEFYVKRLFARERIEDKDAKWLNMIMDVSAQEKFIKSYKTEQ